jgi:hypothetical protein
MIRLPSEFICPKTIKQAFLAVLLSLSMPTVGVCNSANTNPLIGSWKFSSTNKKSGPAECDSTFVFTEKMATITASPSNVIFKGSARSMAVTYIVASPKLVAVMTNAPGSVEYNLVNNNRMYTEDAWGRCNYDRTK